MIITDPHIKANEDEDYFVKEKGIEYEKLYKGAGANIFVKIDNETNY